MFDAWKARRQRMDARMDLWKARGRGGWASMRHRAADAKLAWNRQERRVRGRLAEARS